MNEGRGGPSGLPQASWDAATRPGEPGYRDHLTQLLRNVTTLPGAVFVRIPDGELSAPEWSELVDTTGALCACGHRRLLEPVVRHDWDAWKGGETFIVTPDRPLEITPWGGDRQSALLRFEVTSSRLLLGRPSPYLPRPYEPMQSVVECMAIVPIDPPSSSRRQPFDELAAVVRDRGSAVAAQPYGPTNEVIVPVCAVTAVDPAEPKVHIRLHPSVMRTDLAAPYEPHVCGS